MHPRRLCPWLAILAITLQAAWPLLVNAKPRSVALVPLCTVDGVTHYLEVPTGDDSTAAQHQHCGFCALGAAGIPNAFAGLRLGCDVAAERTAPRPGAVHSRDACLPHGARAPPVLSAGIQ